MAESYVCYDLLFEEDKKLHEVRCYQSTRQRETS